jgi:hypothetical protein
MHCNRTNMLKLHKYIVKFKNGSTDEQRVFTVLRHDCPIVLAVISKFNRNQHSCNGGQNEAENKLIL